MPDPEREEMKVQQKRLEAKDSEQREGAWEGRSSMATLVSGCQGDCPGPKATTRRDTRETAKGIAGAEGRRNQPQEAARYGRVRFPSTNHLQKYLGFFFFFQVI